MTIELPFEFEYEEGLVECDVELTYSQLPNFEKELEKVVFTNFPTLLDSSGTNTEVIDPIELDKLSKFVFEYINDFGVDKFFKLYVKYETEY